MKLEVMFGAMAPPLATQLHQPKATVGHLQRLADAICLLAIHGVFTEAEVHKARQRVMKQILQVVAANKSADPVLGRPTGETEPTP